MTDRSLPESGSSDVRRRAYGAVALVVGVLLLLLAKPVRIGGPDEDCINFVYLVFGSTGLLKGFLMLRRGQDESDS
jgi:hypothetical protein